MHILCVGQCTLDYVWHADTLPTGEGKHLAHAFQMQGGGIAANAAVAIARLGAQVRLWSRVGDDAAGLAIREELIVHGVGVESVEIVPSAQTSVSSITVDAAGERQIVNFRGTKLAHSPPQLPNALLSETNVVLADTRWPEAAMCAFATARAAGVPTVLDADVSAQEIVVQLLPLTDFAIFSAPGFHAFAPGATDIEMALRSAFMQSMRMVAVTCGAQGVAWCDSEDFGTLPAFTISDVKDTTGAGDAFHGAFAYAIAVGQLPRDALRFASASAALKCRHIGARNGLPTADTVANFITEFAPKVQNRFSHL